MSYSDLCDLVFLDRSFCTDRDLLSHRWQRICSICRFHNPELLSSLFTNHLICYMNNTMAATSSIVITWVDPTLSMGFVLINLKLLCAVYCGQLFVFFYIVFSALGVRAFFNKKYNSRIQATSIYNLESFRSTSNIKKKAESKVPKTSRPVYLLKRVIFCLKLVYHE